MTVHKFIEYQDASGTVFEGELYHPNNVSEKHLPAVIIFPAFRGITEFEKSKAEKLANEQGYIAFVADVYGKGVRPTDKAEAFAICGSVMESRVEKLKPRLEATLNAVRKIDIVDQSRISAMGYCFGGLCVLDMARYHMGLRAVISFHGTLKPVPELALDEIKDTSIFVHHGDADSHINKEQVDNFHEEMRTRNSDFVFVSHSKAMHSFTEPEADSFGFPGVGYNEKAANRSWAASLDAFREAFSQ